MNRIENQLNKVKTSNKIDDLSAKNAKELLEIITENELLQNKSVALIGSKSGILLVGTGLLYPKYLVSIHTESFDQIISQNTESFKIPCDLILTIKPPFQPQSFDISIVNPQLNKSKLTDFSEIKIALKISKKIYFSFRSDQLKYFQDNFPNLEIIGKIVVNSTLSQHYKTDSMTLKEFVIAIISQK
jgi:hypothetical protein